jgi:PIN domain nuclease of toxin-antitoxin system
LAALTFLDTHVAVWLYNGNDELLSPDARSAIASDELRISPMVVMEAEYLHEIGRLRVRGEEVANSLAAEHGVQRDGRGFGAILRQALPLPWTRDPFDRLIVGHAMAADARLLTKDQTIREQSTIAFW